MCAGCGWVCAAPRTTTHQHTLDLSSTPHRIQFFFVFVFLQLLSPVLMGFNKSWFTQRTFFSRYAQFNKCNVSCNLISFVCRGFKCKFCWSSASSSSKKKNAHLEMRSRVFVSAGRKFFTCKSIALRAMARSDGARWFSASLEFGLMTRAQFSRNANEHRTEYI